MFQHDAFGTIKETLFVDFQVGKYGSPVRITYLSKRKTIFISEISFF